MHRYLRTVAFLMGLIPTILSSSWHGSDEAVVSISAALCEDMKLHHVLGPKAVVGCDRLKLVRFSYVDFDMKPHDDGEIVVMDAAAPYVRDIFAKLRDIRFPIASARMMSQYDGNDDASMNDNNTSGFNGREIAAGGSISLHAYGLAIDLNPIQNPYMVRSTEGFTVSPLAGAKYVNRTNDRPWKYHRSGMAEAVIDIFADNGFLIWGGYWDDPIDYQHFQVGRALAERLAGASVDEAKMIFDSIVLRYRNCLEIGSDRIACIMTADPTAGE